MRVLPASFWTTTTVEERALFGHRHGIYSFSTVELVRYLRDLIGKRVAIEIGAGHGVLSNALGITATDTREQEDPAYQTLYLLMGQPTVKYGPNVVQLPASRAVRHYRPHVVIGCWITQNYDPSVPWRGDSKHKGIDEEQVLANCEQYVLIGNEKVHDNKRIWTLPHTIEYPDWLYSRAHNGSREFIAIWQGAGRCRG